MKLLARSQIRFLLRVPWSAMAALLGVTLGVASVVAVHQISTSVDRTLRMTMPPHLAQVTHLLARDDLDAERYFELRDRWRSGGLGAVQGMLPIVEGQVPLQAGPARIVGADWLALPGPASDPRVSGPAEGPLGGQLPALSMLAGAAVVGDAGLGLREGASLTISGRTVSLAGVVESGFGPAIFADMALAHELLGLPASALSYIGVSARDPWVPWRTWLERLMPGISAGLPAPRLPQSLAADWRVRPVTDEMPSASFARSVLFNLGALGTLALLVAWFLIYQVAVIWLRRQRLLVSRLSVLGVRPGEFLRSFLVGFAALGLIATVFGLLLGQWFARVLVQMTAAGLAQTASMPALDVWVTAKAVVSGLGICLVSGWMACAGHSAGGWNRRRIPRWWSWPAAGLLVVVAGAGISVEASGLAGGFLSILALSLLAVMAVGLLLGGLRMVSGRIGGRLLFRIGLREAAWYPRVVGAALAALSLAVATSIAMGLMVESFRLDFSRMLETRLAGDLYVRGPPARIAEARDWLDRRSDVRDIRGYGSSRQRVGGLPVDLTFGRHDVWEMRRYGYAGALGDDGIVISERLSRDLGVGLGDVLQVDSAPARRPADGEGYGFEVVHIFPGFGDPVARALITVGAARDLGLLPLADRLTVVLASGSDVPAALSGRFRDLEVQPRASVRTVALKIFDRTFAVTQALTLLALTVAVVGMYNALTALRLTQAPTLRLLAFQGVTPGELRALALLRSLTLGGLALLLALPLGLAMAWVLCGIINTRAFGWSIQLQLPASGLVPPLVLGLAAALLAGLLPAPHEQGDLDDAS